MSLVAHPYLTAMRDPKIAADDYVAPSWAGWWVAHAALDAEPPPAVEVPHWREIWDTISGGRPWPTVRPREPHLYGSRRIAKTREFSRRGAWACVTFDERQLARGERGVFQFYAPDRSQASIAFDYAAAFIEGSDLLRNMIESRTKTELRFVNRTTMRVATANFRTARGWTSIGAHLDESAFMWDGEQSANPIGELLAAARPAMSTIPTAQLSSATTPRGRTGEVWSIFDRHWAQSDSRVLVLRADHTFNPTLDPAIVQEAIEQDEAVARAEYFAEFRPDLEMLLPRSVVTQNVIAHRGNLPPCAGQRVAWFTDLAGGSGADSATLSGAAKMPDGRVVVVFSAERRPPFSPDEVAREFAEAIKSYGGSAVCGDRFAGEWPRERFRKYGVSYQISERTKSQIYQDALPLLTGARIELPDNPRLINQLCALERRVPRGGGRESIDHPPKGHDDVCNAVLGAATLATVYRRGRSSIVYLEQPSTWTPPPRLQPARPLLPRTAQFAPARRAMVAGPHGMRNPTNATNSKGEQQMDKRLGLSDFDTVLRQTKDVRSKVELVRALAKSDHDNADRPSDRPGGGGYFYSPEQRRELHRRAEERKKAGLQAINWNQLDADATAVSQAAVEFCSVERTIERARFTGPNLESGAAYDNREVLEGQQEERRFKQLARKSDHQLADAIREAYEAGDLATVRVARDVRDERVRSRDGKPHSASGGALGAVFEHLAEHPPAHVVPIEAKYYELKDHFRTAWDIKSSLSGGKSPEETRREAMARMKAESAKLLAEEAAQTAAAAPKPLPAPAPETPVTIVPPVSPTDSAA